MVACFHGSPDWVCNGDDELCFACETEMHDRFHPEPVDGCRECKFRTIQVHSSCRGSARNSIPPEGTADRNSWERGLALDARGMPYRDAASGALITVKRFAENRHRYEDALRRNAAGAT
jgi:hypothetical protein